MIRSASLSRRALLVVTTVVATLCGGCDSGSLDPMPPDPSPRDGGSIGDDASGPAPVRDLSETEPNDGPEVSQMQNIGTIGQGQTILRGQLASGGNDGVSYTGDFDLFVFEIAGAGDLTVEVAWDGTADVDAVIYDESGTARAQDGTTARPITLRFAANAGLYGLQLYSKDLAADWNVTFTLAASGTVTPPGGGSCTSPIAENFSGGCTLVQNEPTNGQQIVLPFTFGWSASGCETPFRLFIYGNPPTEDNATNFQISRLSGGDTTEWAGSYTVTAADLAGIRSDNGIYHWAVSGFYGSNTAGRTFAISPASCR